VTADFFYIINDSNPLETATVYGFRNNQIQSLVDIRMQNPINYINQFQPTTEIARFEYRSLKCMNQTAYVRNTFASVPFFCETRSMKLRIITMTCF